MAWFQVDDQLSFHPKVIQAGNAAMGMWVRAGAWSQAHLTEGHIPAEQAKALGGLALAKKLVAAGLWDTDDERGGFQFHQWDARQMSAEEIKERRNKRSASGKKGGAASAAARRAKAEARKRAEDEARREASASANVQANASTDSKQMLKQNPTPAPVPTQKNSTYVPEAAHESDARSDDLPPPDERPTGPPVRPDAAKLVRDHIRRDLPATVLTSLRLSVGEMIVGGTATDVLAEALTRWNSRSGVGPGILPSLVVDVLKERDGGVTRNSPSRNPTSRERSLNGWDQLKDNPQQSALDTTITAEIES